MSTTDIVVFVGVAAAAAMLLRLASANKSVSDQLPPAPDLYAPPVAMEPPERELPLIGREIGLPFDVEQLALETGIGHERPEVTNYFFKQTRLNAGPPDPNDFVDELTLALRNPVDQHHWSVHYTIATPDGLKRLMAEKRYHYILGEEMIIVPRFDLAEVLRAALEHQFTLHLGDPSAERLIDDSTDSDYDPDEPDDDRR